jgi:transcription antitermination factor NusB
VSLATERRAARERALGLLYEAEAKGTTGAEVLASLPVDADDFAVALVVAVDEHRARIDELLSRFAKGWTLARMPALDRAALRMGTAELIARPDVPTGVVLSETVDLASRFSTDGSGRFVNGLLARVADEVRGPGAAAALDVDYDDDDDDDDPLVPEVDALVIDLDGVIRHWDPKHTDEADARLGLPAGTISHVALDADRLARVVDGRLPFEAWCEEIGTVVAADHEVSPTEVAEAWATATWQVDLGVLALVEEVRELVPVALLSNASSHLEIDLDLSGIGDAFDLVVGSAELGHAKPAPEAFQAAADGLRVALARTLFIDDMDANVEGARAVGMRAERFTGVDDLRDLLRSLQLVR